MSVVLDSYPESNFNINLDQYSGNATASGQSFTTPNNGVSYALGSVKFYLKSTGSPTGNAFAKLYAHTGTYGTSSLPTGAALATSDAVDVTTISSTQALVTFHFSTPYTMSPNTHYFISYEHAGGDASNTTNVGNDSSSPTHGGNLAYFAGVWTVLNSRDMIFYAYSTDLTFTLPATQAAFSLTGNNAYKKISRLSAMGSFSLTGISALFSIGHLYTLVVSVANFVLTRVNAILSARYAIHPTNQSQHAATLSNTQQHTGILTNIPMS